MGCGNSNTEIIVKEIEKPIKKKVPIENLIQQNLKNQKIIRKEGEISGNPFQVDLLENCEVLITDFIDSVTIDRCKNCTFVLGVVKGSIFVRDCQNCIFNVICGQFRCRSCTSCNFYLHSKTGPVIEASSLIEIGCCNFSYEGILNHLKICQIDQFYNPFYDVHDFTPSEKNFIIQNGKKLINDLWNNLPKYLPFYWIEENNIISILINENEINLLINLSHNENIKLFSIEKQKNQFLCKLSIDSKDFLNNLNYN